MRIMLVGVAFTRGRYDKSISQSILEVRKRANKRPIREYSSLVNSAAYISQDLLNRLIVISKKY